MTGRMILALTACLLGTAFGLVEADAEGFAASIASVFFWISHIGLGLAIAVFAQRLLSGLVAGLPQILQLLIGGIAGSLLFTPVALGLELLLAPLIADKADYELGTGAALWQIGLAEWGSVLPIFLPTWVALNLGYRALSERPSRPITASDLYPSTAQHGDPLPTARVAKAASVPSSGILGKLPGALGTEICALEADLNYLRVTTAQGEAMVLYSMARAEAELAGKGLRIHRRYWVASNAVVAVRRGGKGWRVTLAGGRELPVSRRRQAAVRAMFGPDFRRREAP